MIVVGQAVVDWVAQRTGAIFGVARGIGLSRGGKIAAGVAYTDFNQRNIFVHVACDGPLTRKFLWTICDYPFNQLGVERVTGMIPAAHRNALDFAERIGFKYEATLENAHPKGNLLIYVAHRDNLAWLQQQQYRKAA